MTKKTPSSGDAYEDYLTALNADLKELDQRSAEGAEQADADADSATAERFLDSLGFPPAPDAVGTTLRAFRGSESPHSFAKRYGISVEALETLEANDAILDFDDIDDAARRASSTAGIPVLKVLRVLKAVAAKRPSRGAAEPLLQAARKKPDGDG